MGMRMGDTIWVTPGEIIHGHVGLFHVEGWEESIVFPLVSYDEQSNPIFKTKMGNKATWRGDALYVTRDGVERRITLPMKLVQVIER